MLFRSGPAADVLGRAADRADMLVIGSHGHGPLDRTALGSVAEVCVRDAICPVVIIPAARSSSTSYTGEALATAGG